MNFTNFLTIKGDLTVNIGKSYWTVYFNEKSKFIQVCEATWKDDMVDRRREKEGRIFNSRKEAEKYKEQLR